MGIGSERKNIRFKALPGTIRELLKRLIERRVTLILDAETRPEHVEIEAVVGDLVVAELRGHEGMLDASRGVDVERPECRRWKFIRIECICAVIVDCDDLVEGLFSPGEFEEEPERREIRNVREQPMEAQVVERRNYSR